MLRWILCFPKRRCFYLGNLFSWTISSKTSTALCLSSKILWKRYGAEDCDEDKDHTSCQRGEGFVCPMLIFVYEVITFKIIVKLMTLFQLWQAVKSSFIRRVEYLLLWNHTDQSLANMKFSFNIWVEYFCPRTSMLKGWCSFLCAFFPFPQVEYICKTKIYAVLEEISDTVLIVMPEEQVCTVEYLLETNKVFFFKKK